MFKYSYDALVYYGEKVDESIKRLAKFGYDAIELVGEPDYYDSKEVRKLCAEYGIKVSSICSVYNSARDLAHPDLAKRRQAIDYVKKIADFSAEVGAPTMIVAPTACNKTQALAADRDEHQWAVEGMREGGEYAAKLNVKLCIEAWNRYETYMCNRLDQARTFMKDINLPNVGIMGDTFHMNIEEPDMAEAIRQSKDGLIHIHLADTNRAAPGIGHMDYLPILKALKEIDYQGYLTFEILPAAADPFGVMRKGGHKDFFDNYTGQCIKYIKEIEKQL